MHKTSQIIRIAVFAFLAVLAGFHAEASAATYYVSPDGSDSRGNGAYQFPWHTIVHATARMRAGDTLVLRDGLYVGELNTISPPSGRDGMYTTIRAEHDGRALLAYMPMAINLSDTHYVQIEGIDIRDLTGSHAINIVDSDHIKVLRTSIRNGSAWDARYGNVVSISGNSHHVLIEDVWITGAMRTGVIVYGNHARPTYNKPAYTVSKVILRRVVCRNDGNMEREPASCIVIYGNNDGDEDPGLVQDALIQNSIVLDTNQGVVFQNLVDGFVTAKRVHNLGYQGSIALNLRGGGFYMSERIAAQNIWADNSLAWGCVNEQWGKAFYARDGDPDGAIKLTNVTAGACPFGVLDYGKTQTQWEIRDSVFQDNAKVDTSIRISVDEGNLTDPGMTSIVQRTNGKGAEIFYRYGRDGTLWGEEGFDELTDVSLWPWPHEDRIKLVFSERNDPPIESGYTNDTTRGFCAQGNGLYGGPITLTSYIWEYLGSPCPVEVCGRTVTLGER